MEQEFEMERGKRPRTTGHYRHLPSSVPLSSTKSTKTQTKNIPLFKMKYDQSTTSPDPQSDSKLRRRSRGRAQEAKEKTRQFVTKSTVDDAANKKRRIIWIVSSLWLLFILYRVYTSLKDKDFGKLSITHFF